MDIVDASTFSIPDGEVQLRGNNDGCRDIHDYDPRLVQVCPAWRMDGGRRGRKQQRSSKTFPKLIGSPKDLFLDEARCLVGNEVEA